MKKDTKKQDVADILDLLNGKGADDSGDTSEEAKALGQLLKAICDGNENVNVIGVGKISGDELAAFCGARRLPDDLDGKTDGHYKRELPDEDAISRMNSTITIHFDANGDTPSYALDLDICGSSIFAELVMAEALCQLVAQTTPEVRVKALAESILMNILVARAAALTGLGDDDADDDDSDNERSNPLGWPVN